VRALRSGTISVLCLGTIVSANAQVTGWLLWIIVLPTAALYGYYGRDFVVAVELQVRRAVRAWRSRGDAA
jgi:hypothetical protein